MLRKKEINEILIYLRELTESHEKKIQWLDNRTRILCDYADHFDALVKHLGLDFEKVPAAKEEECNQEKLIFLRNIIKPGKPVPYKCSVCEKDGYPSIWSIKGFSFGICTECANKLREIYKSDSLTMMIDIPGIG